MKRRYRVEYVLGDHRRWSAVGLFFTLWGAHREVKYQERSFTGCKARIWDQKEKRVR